MEAIEFHGDERADLVERPDAGPAPGELLLAPRAVGVCGTDVEIFEGTMTYYRSGLARYPVVPGHEWVAEVVEVGAGVTAFAPGDRVVGECSVGCGVCGECERGAYHLCSTRTETGVLNRDGAMATRMTFPSRSAFLVPEAVPTAAAALVEPTAVALNAARRVDVSGRSVLVIGAGPIGLLAAQCAKAIGAAAVLVGDLSPERREVAAGFDFDAVLPLGADLAADVLAVRDGAGADGADVAIVCAGAPAALELALQAVRPGGSVVVVALFGLPRVELDVDRVVVRDIELHGVLGSPNRWPEAISLIAAGAVDTAALTAAPVALDRVGEAIEEVRGGSKRSVKVLVDPGASG
jgi:L-iditol 2-dehydrogenase